MPLYLGTTIGSNVAAGVYTETLSIFWNWNYCSGIGIGSVCVGRDINSGTTTLTVNLTVSNDCTITAPNIAFGSAPVVSAFTPVTGQTINLACTKGSAYTVGLSDGQNPLSIGGRRRMISGSNYLAYDIFKSAGSTRWGSVGAARRASTDAEVNPGNGWARAVRFSITTRRSTPTRPRRRRGRMWTTWCSTWGSEQTRIFSCGVDSAADPTPSPTGRLPPVFRHFQKDWDCLSNEVTGVSTGLTIA